MSATPSGSGMFPFALKFFDEPTTRVGGNNNIKNSSANNNSNNKSKNYRFQIKTNVYMKPPKTTLGTNNKNKATSHTTSGGGGGKNILYQFNLSTWDENVSSGDTAVVQIIMINRQQRVKLVFSQPIDRVIRFQDEFQARISNLTGFKAYIDKVDKIL